MFTQRIATGATCNRPKLRQRWTSQSSPSPRHRSRSSSLATSDALSYRDRRQYEHDFDLFCTESAQLSCEVRIQPHIFAFPDCGSSSIACRDDSSQTLSTSDLFIAIAIFSLLFTPTMSPSPSPLRHQRSSFRVTISAKFFLSQRVFLSTTRPGWFISQFMSKLIFCN